MVFRRLRRAGSNDISRVDRRPFGRTVACAFAVSLVILGLGGCGMIRDSYSAVRDALKGSAPSETSAQDEMVMAAKTASEPMVATLSEEEIAEIEKLAESLASQEDLAEVDDRLARLEGQLVRLAGQVGVLRAEFQKDRPQIYRLLGVESDIRQLLYRVSELTGEPLVSNSSVFKVPETAPSLGVTEPVEEEPQTAAPAPAEKTPESAAESAETAAVALTEGAGDEPESAAPSKPEAFGVHLASYRQKESAEGGWKQLRSAHRDVLDGLEFSLQEVELAERGTFYRLKAGPLTSAEEARRICDTLTTRQVFCVVTIFGGAS